jgi:adenosylcobyric acid synthase
VSFAAVREQRYDVLADMIEAHLDTDALAGLIDGGVPAGLPTDDSGLAPAQSRRSRARRR